jgi:hypothetical protein
MHARWRALRQYLTGSVHITVTIVMWKEMRERAGPGTSVPRNLPIEISRNVLLRHTRDIYVTRISRFPSKSYS